MSNPSINGITSTPVEDVNSAKNKKTTSTKDSDFSKYLDDAKGSKTSLDSIFQRAAKKYNVDVNLLKAIAKKESEFDPKATSRSGAMGIMQLMPGTAKYLGVKDAYDPEQNIMGGAKLISQLLKQYKGNVTLALAAYNAGSGNVKKYGGVPPFKETQNYVVKVQEFYKNGVTIPSGRQSVNTASSPSSKAPSLASQTNTTTQSSATFKTPNADLSNTAIVSDATIVNINPMLESSLAVLEAQDQMLDTLQKILSGFRTSEEGSYSYDEYSRFLKTYLDSIAVSTLANAEDKGEKDEYNVSKHETPVSIVDTTIPNVDPNSPVDPVTYATQTIQYNPAVLDLLLRK